MPTRAATDEEVASRACVMIGTQPITSFEDGTTEATAVATIYEDVVTEVMTTSRWRFAATSVMLNRLSDPPPEGKWAVQWQLPSDLLSIIGLANKDGYPQQFDRFLQTVRTDEIDNVYLDYIRRVPTVDWPPYFTLPVIHLLASELAIAVAQNEGLSELHAAKYERFASIGRTTDAQGRTNSVLRLDRYEKARRSGSP